jgi:hypothetical protein
MVRVQNLAAVAVVARNVAVVTALAAVAAAVIDNIETRYIIRRNRIPLLLFYVYA